MLCLRDKKSSSERLTSGSCTRSAGRLCGSLPDGTWKRWRWVDICGRYWPRGVGRWCGWCRVRLHRGRRRRASSTCTEYPPTKAQVRVPRGLQGNLRRLSPNGGWLSVRPARPQHSFIPKNAMACVGPRRQGREWPHVLMDSDHGETPPHGDWAWNGVLLLRLDGDDAARSPRNVLDAED
jgi:hypothetical protein